MYLRFRFILILLMCALAGCNSLPFQLTFTPTPSPTATPTRTPVPTKTFTPTPTATPIFASYPLRHVLFKYTISGFHGAFEEFGLYEGTLLVIYSDGQMIASREGDKRIKSKYLTTKEVCSFVNKLDSFGFFSIDAPQTTEESNPLYDFGSKYQKVHDGLFRSLVLNGMSPRRVSVYEPYKDFLVRPMKRMLDFVETYNPGGLTNYQPDRMLLFVESGRGGLEAEQVKTGEWGADLPSLRLGDEGGYIFLEAEEAGQVYDFLSNSKANVFTEGNAEYRLVQRVLYPHESLNASIDPLEAPTDVLLPINCNP